MTLRRLLALTAVPALALVLSAVHGAAESPRDKAWEDYEALIDNNMFSRERGRPDPSVDAPVVREAPSPERYVLLRGIVKDGDGFIAFLEDMRSGELIQAREGDEVVRGRLVQVGLDGITYEFGESRTEVTIGSNLEMAAAVSYFPSPAGPEAEQATAAPASSVAAPGGASDILERLRQQRMKELGQ